MIDTRHLGRVLEEADRAGAEVVLVGDPNQMKEGDRPDQGRRERPVAERAYLLWTPSTFLV
jgi:hypothetical protein